MTACAAKVAVGPLDLSLLLIGFLGKALRLRQAASVWYCSTTVLQKTRLPAPGAVLAVWQKTVNALDFAQQPSSIANPPAKLPCPCLHVPQ